MSAKKRFVITKKAFVITAAISVVILACVSVILLSQQNSTNTDLNKNTEQPRFATLLPEGKSIEKLGGWIRISPPSTEPVFAYNDAIGDVSINVSQQPLPESFKEAVDTQVAGLAKQYSATKKINAGLVKVYIGISSKGPQSVIFTKNNLLILIKSQQKIDDKDWSKYIESLN